MLRQWERPLAYGGRCGYYGNYGCYYDNYGQYICP